VCHGLSAGKNRWVLSVNLMRKPVSIYIMIGFVGVSILTLISLGSSALLPVDSRTNMPVPGLHMTFPVLGSLLEPFTALSHIIAFTPDYRVGILSIALWILSVIFLFIFFRIKTQGGTLLLASVHAFKITVRSLFLFILYMSTALVSHFPDWSVQKDKGSIIIADLHSHCLLSHDGVISARENLRLHKDRGYDVVAFTDHVNPKGAFVAYKIAGKGLPEALPGIEVPTYFGAHYYFIAFGMDSDTPLPNGLAFYGSGGLPLPPLQLPSDISNSVKYFIDIVHQHHGVVLTVGLHLKASDVYALAETGVDGFEYINYGHRPLSASVRKAMLDVQQTKGLVLAASNDWHGWTGVLNAYTVVASKPDDFGHSPKNIIMDALRNHDANRIIPAVFHPVHLMSISETIIAPFTSILLYARALSTWQLVAWWGWLIIFTLLLRMKSLEHRHRLTYTVQISLVSLGLMDIFSVIGTHSSSLQQSSFHTLFVETRFFSITLGLTLLFIALFLINKLHTRCLFAGYILPKWIPFHIYGGDLP